jgi:exopolysaccharide biosynthesis polyprenyl glycosylphosphotransferase
MTRRRVLRAGVDAVAVSAAMFMASFIRFDLLHESPARKLDYTTITLIATPVAIFLFWVYGLYEPRQVLSPVTEFKQVLHAIVAGVAGIFLVDSLFNLHLARGWALLVMAGLLVVVGGERLIVRKVLHFLRRRGGDRTRTIVLGANQEARIIARTLERETWLGYEMIGFADDTAPRGQRVDDTHPVLGTTDELHELIEEHAATLVLVAASAFDAARLNRLLWELQDADVDMQITSGTVDLLASRVTVQSVAGIPLLYVRRTGMNLLQKVLKRTTDLIVGGLGLLVLSPVLLAIGLRIRTDSEGPMFFTQVRVGQDGKLFRVWKFRTMFEDAELRRTELEHLSEGPGLLFKLREDPRVTKVGGFLRRYSLDELPQLWNVLKGDMSLVGPRPALPSEVEQYDDWVLNRLRVKPGMTGLWQVSGRTETSFADYVRFDLFYIQNWSLTLDLSILIRTLRAVISSEGAH